MNARRPPAPPPPEHPAALAAAAPREHDDLPGEKLGGDPNVMGPLDSENLARQDGRSEAREADRARVRHELLRPAAEGALEIPAGAEELVTWNTAPDEAGHATRDQPADDESDVSADMADQGGEQADRELRRAAHDDEHPLRRTSRS